MKDSVTLPHFMMFVRSPQAFIAWLTSVEGTFRERTVRGGIWVLLAKIGSHTLGLIKVAILARLLAPSDFGLLGIALFSLACLETFTGTGFYVVLIQRKGDIEPYLDTAFTIQVVRGVGLSLAIFFLAPYIAGFFSNAAATPIIRAVGLLVLLESLSNPATVNFAKHLHFQKIFYWNLTGLFVGLVVSVSCALIFRNVWALVFSVVADQVTKTALSYFIEPYRPRFRIDAAKARELTNFGKWVSGARILNFCFLNGDKAAVGKVLGASDLGLYQLAQRVSNFSASQVSHVLGTVLFPAYSEIRENKALLKQTYFKALKVVLPISLGITTILLAFPETLVSLLFGQAWVGMASAVRILAVFSFFKGVALITGPLLISVGMPHVDTLGALISVIILALIIVPLTSHFGIQGTSWAVLLSSLPAYVYQFVVALKVVKGAQGSRRETLGNTPSEVMSGAGK